MQKFSLPAGIPPLPLATLQESPSGARGPANPGTWPPLRVAVPPPQPSQLGLARSFSLWVNTSHSFWIVAHLPLLSPNIQGHMVSGQLRGAPLPVPPPAGPTPALRLPVPGAPGGGGGGGRRPLGPGRGFVRGGGAAAGDFRPRQSQWFGVIKGWELGRGRGGNFKSGIPPTYDL